MPEYPQNPEEERLQQDTSRTHRWKRWGPYLAERQWGTVREDYSANGDVWTAFPHDHARRRAYRWGEDGLLGFCDRQARLCLALALWNEQDPILKERLFGLTGPEGNHGEDVKEHYFYLASTPTHSYAKAAYWYPHQAYPYVELVQQNAQRHLHEREFEIGDTGVFADHRYHEITAEYAKASPDDLLLKISVTNRGPEPARLHVLPTAWFRNTWIWGCAHEGCTLKPRISATEHPGQVHTSHQDLEDFTLAFGPCPSQQKIPQLLFTENETNTADLYQEESYTPYTKDAFHRFLIANQEDAVNPELIGTKVAAHYLLSLQPGETQTIAIRLAPTSGFPAEPFVDHAEIIAQRHQECQQFYRGRLPSGLASVPEYLNIVEQGYAGLLWSKQFYHYIVEDWLQGDPNQPPPPPNRAAIRNAQWTHLYSRDILSMPDKWEFPWFAVWDTAFHMIPFARIDSAFVKHQLNLFLREWYLHPNGQIPAYEFAFDDVNPPVHAWAAWRVYKIAGRFEPRDREFLEGIFQKCLLNFTWWVNRKDEHGQHLFAGGFLGLDNIGAFDRSKPLPPGISLQQADGTAWMAFYAITMLAIALELAWDGKKVNRAYEDMASKFFEHFIQITDAMNSFGETGLWDEEDGFYYDQITCQGHAEKLRVRSLVGILPIIAVEVIPREAIAHLPGFSRRLEWFLKYRPDLSRHITYLDQSGDRVKKLLAMPSRERLVKVLQRLLDENEFLSPYGIRSVSKYHLDHPFKINLAGEDFFLQYVPGESDSPLFGGNSNWRGPIWFPINYLLIEALERYHFFYGDSLKVECPTGSGNWKNLEQVARDLEWRLASLFLPDENGQRPCHGKDPLFDSSSGNQHLVYFYEHFHGDHGRGLGASHQTGWTSLVIRNLEHIAKLHHGGYAHPMPET